ncbi:MAG: hypothetical protein KJZ79_14965 [Bryobacteraceae bacterium]|nr:hypothetical protein [Bryobacteraceae bacterium]
MRTTYLVACVAGKSATPLQAGEIYTSPWFRKASDYVRGCLRPGDRWFILSAQHHLVHPEQVIAPYNLTLLTMKGEDRRKWGEIVLGQLRKILVPGERVVLLAGARYREQIEEPLRAMGCVVEVPMRGLSIGRQLSWLNNPALAHVRPENLRLNHLTRFYALLSELESRLGGCKRLMTCSRSEVQARRGVYFFFEQGEDRSDTGSGLRVVRVGTHAVSQGSKATLWQRLSQHRGRADGAGGNHRGSVFRKLVGRALLGREADAAVAQWGEGSSAPKDVRLLEQPVERMVSAHIGAMPFLWLEADDDPSPESIRSYIEKNSISLLSNAACRAEEALDPPSSNWLGHDCPHLHVRQSGLWNSNYVLDEYDPAFLEELERLVRQVGSA